MIHGDTETWRHGHTETRRHGDTETRTGAHTDTGEDRHTVNCHASASRESPRGRVCYFKEIANPSRQIHYFERVKR